MLQKTNTSDKTTNEDILKELKSINTQLITLNNKIEESNLLARESKSSEDTTRYTDQIVSPSEILNPNILITYFGFSKECSFILGYSAMEDSYASEIERKELLQKKHYFFLNELQQMARELPSKYQQRVPYDLLSGLAHALLDGTVFEIVQGLSEVQHLEEKSLFNQRVKQTNDHKAQKHEMTKKHKELLQACENKPHNLPLVQAQVDREREIMNKRIEEESKKKDIKTIMELDQKVMDQQVTLEKAGVPGFYVTNNPAEIRLQIYLLEFIVRLRNTELPT
ncbi:Hypothetical predicted protein [Octopus vulgaris]|uniref:Protein DGCR6 n=2 Tax=Octopus TaxID=6643 RepID=A0AA36EXB0_OCTVU|nr:Hypothetical predicted protein [Octopus vulgaris]